MAGIYIHIPFCKQACHYCDFHFSTSTNTQDSVVQAICRELELQKKYLNEPLKTIYFGGGTPSLLKPKHLSSILDTTRRHFDTSSVEEMTLEANPDDLSPTKLEALMSLGFDRLSIGIQSFNDKHLKLYNRAHNARLAEESVALAKTAGFENISVDLIFGSPGQTIADLKKDLSKIISLNVPHVSIYGLTIEPNTAFGKWHENGKLNTIEEDEAVAQFELIMNELSNADYEQYEISNFARKGYRSVHNSSYWQGKIYLGIGPSAHSYNGTTRQYNIANNVKYSKAISSGKVPSEMEVLERQDLINETLLIRLRLIEGLDLSYLRENLAFDLFEAKSEEIMAFRRQKLLVINKNHLQLTMKGRLLADHITEKLMVD